MDQAGRPPPIVLSSAVDPWKLIQRSPNGVPGST
jgi:hypothetical protein